MDMRGKFIVIDGMDHAGKGVQLDLLKKTLARHSILFSREPGGTPFAEEIRRIILRKDGPASNPLADFFMYWAQRGSHVEDAVEPHRLKKGHVICDRYDSSTWAYQIYGEERHELRKIFWAIREALPAIYWPDAYIFFDLPAEVAHERGLNAKAKEQTRFDIKPLAYHKRVREGFLTFEKAIKEREKSKVFVVDANRTIEEVHAEVLTIVQKILNI